MYSKALSITVVFLAVLRLHAAPVPDKPHPPAAPAHNPAPPASHTPSKHAGKACALHKRSWFWPRDSDSESECSSEGSQKPLKLYHMNLKGEVDKSDKYEFHLGQQLGRGANGEVHRVDAHQLAGHDHHQLVAKTFNIHSDVHEEAKNLHKVGQLAFKGKIPGKYGAPYVVMPHVKGVHLSQTDAWKNAHTDEDREAVRQQANTLAGHAVLHHIEQHGVHHLDVNDGNVKLSEKNGQLHKARLVDWGNANRHAGAGQRSDADRHEIVNSVHPF